jgi:acyl-homoserine-lactone acylase
MPLTTRLMTALAALVGVVHLQTSAQVGAPPEPWRDVEIVRTAHGVPHIRAANLRAAGYGLAWVMSEDYGSRTGLRLLGARGELSRYTGRQQLDMDFENLIARKRAIDTYHLLEQPTRDIYDGFAAGINRYIELNPGQFPAGMPADFSGYDVATIHIGDGPPAAKVRRLVAALTGQPAPADVEAPDPDEGSNAWALAPSRTRSGHAILLRNPHLAWNAGYYEAQLTVPGVVDYYGDFRIGGPLIVVGGFNRDLGWATTNSNSGDLTEFYALERDPNNANHYLLDGASLPITRELLTVQYKNGDTLERETREYLFTPLGRIVHSTADKVIVARTAGDGEFRAGEQFLRMMRAHSLKEWQDAMRLRALVTSNFTYADRAGNIYNLWNAALPWLPHPSGGDTNATPARQMRDLWTEYIPFSALPQFRNPRGGYVHNENDSPHFANVRQRINIENKYPNIEPPTLRLRSQHAIQLIGGTNRLSLDEVIRLKHSYRMLLADRVKTDLIAAVRATHPSGDVASAVALLRRWNNTAAPTSRGAMLFEIWAQRYMQNRQPQEIFAHPWTTTDPLRTPRGLADPARAAEAFTWAVEETARRHGRWDVAWGDVHRVRRGSVDVPVGGCSGAMGCFRVLTFARDADGKLAANGGDGWVLAVEFGPVPRAYSVLAYGESQDPASPWHADQAAMFAQGRLKRVAFTAADVNAQAVARYRPGEKRGVSSASGRR